MQVTTDRAEVHRYLTQLNYCYKVLKAVAKKRRWCELPCACHLWHRPVRGARPA